MKKVVIDPQAIAAIYREYKIEYRHWSWIEAIEENQSKFVPLSSRAIAQKQGKTEQYAGRVLKAFEASELAESISGGRYRNWKLTEAGRACYGAIKTAREGVK